MGGKKSLILRRGEKATSDINKINNSSQSDAYSFIAELLDSSNQKGSVS
jgi:hypothetical protein